LGILTELDRMTLAGYCQAVAEFRLATEAIQRDGRVIPSEGKVVQQPDGKWETLGAKMIPHPAIAQQARTLRLIQSFAALFGLHPSARLGLYVPGPPTPEVSIFARDRTRRCAPPPDNPAEANDRPDGATDNPPG
jgi:P27 family predicted phage terminase small subunit